MKNENYWSLAIEPGWTQAGIWKIEETSVKVLGISKPVQWTDEDLVEVVDTTLSEAVQSFPEDEKEPSKTVFGVPPSWVSDGQIIKDHLTKIRQICSKLSLSPTGFVVMPEAIAHSVKVQQGSPFTGVVIGVGEHVVDVTLFKLGNLVGTVNVGRSVSVVDDVVEGLARFTSKDPIPTRFLLYDGTDRDLEDLKQELVTAEWEEKAQGRFKFLHTPQVEKISSDEKAIAISIAGASEITEISEVEVMGKFAKRESSPIINKTIEEESNVSQTEDLTPEDIGFVVDEDIKETGMKPETEESKVDTPTNDKPAKKKRFPTPKFSLPKFKLPKFSFSIPRLGGSGPKRIFFILIFVLLLGLGGLGAAWWYLPKAEIVIYVSPKNLEEQEAITLDENIDTADESEMIYPTRRLSVEVSKQGSKQTTGTRTVGEKATGSITIRNGTSSGISFPQGTTLVGPNELEFVTTEEASVSAALSPTEPGSVTVSIEAEDIGADYNLAKDESLSVGNYPKSEVDAVVSDGLSGGSSEEIVAVSQNDLDALEDELLEDLKREGLTKLESEASGMRFIPDSVETSVVDTSFSNDVGDEASSISLELTVEVTGIAIERSTIDNLVKKLLEGQVPEGFSLKTEQVESNFELVDEVDDGVYDFDVEIVANLLPSLDIDQIKANVKGKYPPQAQSYLSSIPGYSSAEVRLSPRFPGKLGVIPRIDKNISVEINAER